MPPAVQLYILYRRVRVVVAPLLSGAGVKGKVRMAAYRTCLTHMLSCSGNMPVQPTPPSHLGTCRSIKP